MPPVTNTFMSPVVNGFPSGADSGNFNPDLLEVVLGENGQVMVYYAGQLVKTIQKNPVWYLNGNTLEFYPDGHIFATINLTQSLTNPKIMLYEDNGENKASFVADFQNSNSTTSSFAYDNIPFPYYPKLMSGEIVNIGMDINGSFTPHLNYNVPIAYSTSPKPDGVEIQITEQGEALTFATIPVNIELFDKFLVNTTLTETFRVNGILKTYDIDLTSEINAIRNESYSTGYSEGYNVGYSEGYAAGTNFLTNLKKPIDVFFKLVDNNGNETEKKFFIVSREYQNTSNNVVLWSVSGDVLFENLGKSQKQLSLMVICSSDDLEFINQLIETGYCQIKTDELGTDYHQVVIQTVSTRRINAGNYEVQMELVIL